MWNQIDFVVRKIPFYEAKTVQKAIHGRLRGRGQRTGFKHPVSKYGYKYAKQQLYQYLPHHLAIEFTLYHTQGGCDKVYTDFKSIRKDGKIVLRLVV